MVGSQILAVLPTWQRASLALCKLQRNSSSLTCRAAGAPRSPRPGNPSPGGAAGRGEPRAPGVLCCLPPALVLGSRAWSRSRPLPRGWSSTLGAPKPPRGGCGVRPSPAASPQPAPAPCRAAWRCFVVAAKPHGLAAGTVYSLGPFQGAAEKMPTDEEKGSLCSQPARAWNNAARKNILSIYTACPSEPPGSRAAEQGKSASPSPGGSVLMEKRPGKLLRPAPRPTSTALERPVLACWDVPTSGCPLLGQLASPSSAPCATGGLLGVTWGTAGPGVRLLRLPAGGGEVGLEQGGPQPCARDPVCAWH